MNRYLKSVPFIQLILKNIATLGFVGYVPYAPGTFGTLIGAGFFMLLNPSLQQHVLILIIAISSGIYASSEAEKILNEKDSRKIVIDEFTGFLVSVLYLPQARNLVLPAFLLFRFFDIIKPLGIKRIEKTLSKGLGIMADDILAGIYTNIILQIWIIIFWK